MAERKAILKVGVEGEREYKSAIAELNRGNQVLNAEMKKLAEEYKGNESSMEAMRAKSDVLERQLLQQKDKVQTLREALQNATNTFGEADRRTQSWQTQLYNAEREQIKLERALEETNKEIAAQGDATEEDSKQMATLGDQVSSVAEKFGIHLPSGIKSALDHVDGFSTGTVAAMAGVAAGIGAVKLAIDAVSVGIKAAQKLNEITLEQAKWADDLLTRSAQTGLGTDTLQGLDYASKFLDFDGIDQSLVKLTASMDKARDGAEKQSEAFQTLGVSVTGTDGQLRDNWETFKDVIDALGQVENSTERDALANDLFGKSYSELKPLIDAGSGALQDLMDKAEQSGYVLDESQIQKLGEVDDAYQEYREQIEATKKKLAVEFAPVAKEVMEKFGDFVSTAGQKLIDSGIIENLGKFMEPLGKILGVLGELTGWALAAVTPLVEALADALDRLASAAEAAFGWLQSVGNWIDEHEVEVTGYENYGFGGPAYNAAGDDNWRGGLTWVGDGGGPELVRLPQGSTIYNAQESRQIAAASATDTSRIETLLSRIEGRLERVEYELADAEAVRRMA